MKVAIYGAGNGGKMFSVLLKEQGHEVVYFIDDFEKGCVKPKQHNKLIPVLAAIFNNKIRLKIVEDFDAITFIHHTAFVYPTARIGKGTIIKPCCMIGNNVIIGKGCIIDSGVKIEHDSVINDGVFISVGSNVGSSVVVGKNSLIGIGCNIQTGVHIGKDCIICSGVTVFNNVLDGEKVKWRVALK